jgi:hypothetical protein
MASAWIAGPSLEQNNVSYTFPLFIKDKDSISPSSSPNTKTLSKYFKKSAISLGVAEVSFIFPS